MELKDQPLHASSSEAVTNNVRVEVESQYAPEHSQPFQNEWFFHYTVRISNEGEGTVQLLSRHWVVTDAAGHVDEFKGPGVVGEQPTLRSGESFQYTSGCPLENRNRRHARHLPHGHRRRRPLRRRNRAVRTARALHRSLGRRCQSDLASPCIFFRSRRYRWYGATVYEVGMGWGCSNLHAPARLGAGNPTRRVGRRFESRPETRHRNLTPSSRRRRRPRAGRQRFSAAAPPCPAASCRER